MSDTSGRRRRALVDAATFSNFKIGCGSDVASHNFHTPIAVHARVSFAAQRPVSKFALLEDKRFEQRPSLL
jgi:hypothetical protein